MYIYTQTPLLTFFEPRALDRMTCAYTFCVAYSIQLLILRPGDCTLDIGIRVSFGSRHHSTFPAKPMRVANQYSDSHDSNPTTNSLVHSVLVMFAMECKSPMDWSQMAYCNKRRTSRPLTSGKQRQTFDLHGSTLVGMPDWRFTGSYSVTYVALRTRASFQARAEHANQASSRVAFYFFFVCLGALFPAARGYIPQL